MPPKGLKLALDCIELLFQVFQKHFHLSSWLVKCSELYHREQKQVKAKVKSFDF